MVATAYQLLYFNDADSWVDELETFADPLKPSLIRLRYEFRYLVANSYTSIATSNPITVT